jgi:ribosome-associated translation inhibitor RaiA
MLNIILKNVEAAEHARALVNERFELLVKRFPDLREHHITVIVEEDQSSWSRRGSRMLSVRAMVDGRKYRAMTLARVADGVHAATAMAVTRLRAMLSRAAGKARRRSLQAFRPLLPAAV